MASQNTAVNLRLRQLINIFVIIALLISAVPLPAQANAPARPPTQGGDETPAPAAADTALPPDPATPTPTAAAADPLPPAPVAAPTLDGTALPAPATLTPTAAATLTVTATATPVLQATPISTLAPAVAPAQIIQTTSSTPTIYLPLLMGGGGPPPADSLAPQIEVLTPWGYIQETQPTITALITDTAAAGIEATAIAVTLDQAIVPSAYLSATGHLTATLTAPLAVGLHQLSISASDRAGHTSTENWQFEVVDPAIAAVVTVDPSAEAILQTVDGRVTLVAPAGAITQPIKIKGVGYPQLTAAELAAGQTPPPGIPFYLFTLDAWRQGDPAEASHFQFEQPITLTTTYLITETKKRVDEDLTLVVRDEISQTWTNLTSAVDLIDQTVTAQTDHFSTYGLTGPDDGILSPSLDGFDVGLFNGGAIYSTDLQLPGGAGGLTPHLSLTYDGTAPNFMYGPNGEGSGWVGIGWSLNLGSINEERLTLNGVSEELVRAGDSNRYHTKHETFFKIESHVDDDGTGHWLVTDKSGVQYYFGAEGSLGANLYYWQPGLTCEKQERDFKLYRVVDPHGNTIEIEYDVIKAGRATCSGIDGVKEAYPRLIRYGLNPAAGDNHAEYQLRLQTVIKDPATHAGSRIAETGRLLDKVRIEYVPMPGGGPQLIREYRFSYYQQFSGWSLIRLEPIGSDGVTPLPALAFDYTRRYIGYRYRGYGLDLTDRWERPFLGRITSDYGARIEYDYQTESYSGHELRQLVSGRTVTELVMGLKAQYRYSYAEPAFEQEDGKDDKNQLLGFARVTVTDPAGKVSRHWFYTDEIKRGREYRRQDEDSQGRVYSRVDQSYTDSTAGLPKDVHFLFLAEVKNYICDGATSGDNTNGCRATRTVYHYDPAQQGGQQFGNVTRVDEYGSGSLLRYNATTYYPNTDRWLVDLPAEEKLYSPDNSLLRHTQKYYDGAGSLTTPPSRGDLTRSRTWLGDDAWAVTTGSYDERGNPLEVTDANGHTVTTGYDSHHLLPTSTRNALGHTGYTTYDYRFQRPLNETDPNGATTAYEYDLFGRLTKVIRPGDSPADPTAAYSYYDPPDPGYAPALRQVDYGGPEGRGLVQLIELYDGLYRPLQRREQVTPAGQQAVTDTYYDSRGLKVKESLPYLAAYQPGWAGLDPAQPATGYNYDLMGRVTRATAPDGSQTQSQYDRGQTTLSDANGGRRRATTDALGRLVKVEEFNGGDLYAATHYSYNAAGDLRQVTDAAGHVTAISYDQAGRKVELDDPDMGRWRYDYDRAGNLLRQVDANGQVISFAYDALNRLAAKDYGDDGAVEVSHTYDIGPNSLGRRSRLDDPAGYALWSYDSRGRVSRSERYVTNTRTYRLGYEYDKLDRQIALIYPDGERVETGYNPRGQADTLTSAPGQKLVAGSTFNALGQLAGQVYGNGVSAGYSYYAPQAGNNRLERLQLTGPGGEPLLNLAYSYDRVGNLTQLVDAAPGLDGPQSHHFEYDFLDRLTLAQSSGGVAGGFDQRFSYDQIGNLTQRTVAGQARNYSYADPEHVHAATGLDSNEYAYDANGNMIWRREAGLDYTQEFDPDNRLVKVTATNGVTTTVTRFVYDGDGVRLARLTAEGSTVYIGGVFEEFFLAGGPLGLAWQDSGPTTTGLAATENRPRPDFPQPAAELRTDPVALAAGPSFAAGRTLAAPLLQPGETDFLIHAGGSLAQWSPAVAYHPARNEHLVAFVHNNGSGSHAANIYAYRLNQTGDIIGSLIAVSTASDFQLDPHVAFNSDANEYLVVWSDNRSGNTGAGVFRPDIYAQRIRASDGQLVGGNFAMTNDSSSQSRPRAAYDAASQRYLVAWQDNRTGAWQIYGQRLDTNAAAVGGNFQINASSNAQEFPDVTAGSSDFLVTWQESVSGNYEIYARRYNGLSGSGARQTVASGAASQQHPRAAYNNATDSYLVGWDEGGNVWVRRTDSEGLPTAAALYLTNTASVTEDFNSLSYCTATGTYLVAWQRGGANRPLQAQQVSGLAGQGDGGGQTIGAIRTIAATVADTQKAVHLATCQSSGWLLAVWEDWRGSDQDIYGRLVDIAPPPAPAMAAEPAWTVGLSNSVSWGSVSDGGSGGVQYQAQRATDSAFSSGVINSGWSANLSYTFSGLVNDQRYYYRVQARDSVLNTSAWSAAVSSSQDATAPQISQPNATPRTISPNGDGFFDSAALTATITETHLANWTLAISRSGTIYRTFSGSSNSINVAWDGRDSGGTVTPDGDYTVAITATDLAGNQRSVTELALVQVDQTPPLLNVSNLSPLQDGQTVSSSQATLRLYADDLRLASVTVNGQNIPPLTGQIYQTVLGPLAAGANSISLAAVDTVQNRTEFSLTVYYDPDGPAIANWRPTGAITATRPTIAADFVDGPSPNILTRTVTLDGQSLPAAATGFSFTPAAELAQGEHTVYVRLVDAAGSEGSAAWSFSVDTGTHLTVERPLPGELVNAGLSRVSGQAEAGATVTLRLNGQPVDETTADGTFALQALELTPGLNTLEIRAVDLLGNVAVDSRTITFDTSRPAATVRAEPAVFSPNGDGQRDETTFWLTAAPPLFSDLAGWQLTIVSGTSVITQAGGGVALPPSLSWDGRQLGGSLAPDGAYDYTLTVTATNGQVTTTPPQAVALDTAPPTAPVITSPAAPLTYTPAAMLRVAGTAEPNLLVTLQSGVFTQVVQAGGDGSWELIFPLQNGFNNLVAIATDRAGQVSPPSAGKQVVVTVEPPLYTVGVTPDLAGQGATVTLEATARHIKPAEGLPTRWLTATVPTGDPIGLTRITTATVPTGSWRSSWSLPVDRAIDGERVVTFRGEDEGGQVGYGETGLVIDTAPPETPWLSQPRGEVWVGEPEVRVSGQAVRLGRLQLYLDGGAGVSSPVDANGEWRVSQPLPGTEHRLQARVTDLAGNLSGWSNEAVVKVDLIAPTATLTVPAVAGGSFTVQWSGDDGSGSGLVAYEVEYQDNGGPWQPWLVVSAVESTARFSGQPHHTYTIRVRAWDRVGHAGEWASGAVEVAAVTKYYLLDGRRVAMRQGDVVYYLHGDHLGSTTLTTDETGAVVAEQRYLPYGELRWSSGALPTDFTFTGQRSEAFGLLDYNARYYDPLLGRFVSADTVVPDFSNPQALNRYSYTLNNPVRYRDPNGHWVESAIDIAFIAYDIYDISQNGWNWENGLSLTADVAGLILPGITGGGLAVRAVAHADDGIKLLSHAEKVVETAKVVENIGEVAGAVNRTGDIAAQLARFEDAGTEVVPDVLKAFGDRVGGYSDIAETAFGDRRITTLGRNVDTDVAAKGGKRVLKVPQLEWSLELNYTWLQDSIKNGDIFDIVSTITENNLIRGDTGEITVLTRELDVLLQAGYQRFGNYLVPPQLLR